MTLESVGVRPRRSREASREHGLTGVLWESHTTAAPARFRGRVAERPRMPVRKDLHARGVSHPRRRMCLLPPNHGGPYSARWNGVTSRYFTERWRGLSPPSVGFGGVEVLAVWGHAVGAGHYGTGSFTLGRGKPTLCHHHPSSEVL